MEVACRAPCTAAWPAQVWAEESRKLTGIWAAMKENGWCGTGTWSCLGPFRSHSRLWFRPGPGSNRSTQPGPAPALGSRPCTCSGHGPQDVTRDDPRIPYAPRAKCRYTYILPTFPMELPTFYAGGNVGNSHWFYKAWSQCRWNVGKNVGKNVGNHCTIDKGNVGIPTFLPTFCR